MNKIEFLKQLRLFIEEGNIEEALNWLSERSSDFTQSFSNDIIMLKNKFSAARGHYILSGVIENEEYNLIIARISYAVLVIADKLEKKSDRLADTQYGQVLHRIPSKMTTLRETKCIIRIAYDFNTLLKNYIVDDETSFESIQITKLMSVELVDCNDIEIFKIRTCTEEAQFTIHDDFTQWIFYVQPLRDGCYPLLLKIAVVEEINGKERKRNIIFEKQINIEAIEIPKDETQFQIANIQLEYSKESKESIARGKESLVLLSEIGHDNKNSDLLVFNSENGEFEIVREDIDSLYPDRFIITEISKEGFACFLKGTKIMVNPTEQKPIENLHIGDEVLTQNRTTNEIRIQKIKNVMIGENGDCIMSSDIVNILT